MLKKYYFPSETGWFEGPTSEGGHPLIKSRFRRKEYQWCEQYYNNDPTSFCQYQNYDEEYECEEPINCEIAPYIILRKKVDTTSTSNSYEPAPYLSITKTECETIATNYNTPWAWTTMLDSEKNVDIDVNKNRFTNLYWHFNGNYNFAIGNVVR